MKYFIDITLSPGPEVPLYFLWHKVYQHIHLAFVEINLNGTVGIGVSFPEYNDEKSHLGNKLRLLSPHQHQLEQLNLGFTSGLNDHLHISPVQKIPHKIQGHAFFKRIQPKNSNERLARRRANRKDISLQQALDYFKGRSEIYSKAPYIHIQSKSTGESYRLIISRQPVQQATSTQLFSTYGLSSSSTVPIF